MISLFGQNAWYLLTVGKEIFGFYIASRPSLGPNEPLLRCVPKSLSLRGLKMADQFHPMSKLQINGAIPPFPNTHSQI